MPKSNAYVKSDDVQQSRDERMQRLRAELREHIRFLNDHDIMSDNWLRMAESLHQIANVAFMEMHLPAAEENPVLGLPLPLHFSHVTHTLHARRMPHTAGAEGQEGNRHAVGPGEGRAGHPHSAGGGQAQPGAASAQQVQSGAALGQVRRLGQGSSALSTSCVWLFPLSRSRMCCQATCKKFNSDAAAVLARY